MKNRWNSLVVGGCNAVGVALLALSVTAGGSAVRAAGDSAVLDSVALEPLMKLADVFQQRIARIEASVAALTDSFNNKRVAQELCVADESGARTCITKAQLDTLLKGAVQTAQTAPAPVSPTGPAACPEKCVAPEAAIAASAAAAAATENPPAAELPAVKETATPAPAARETAATREPATPDAAGVGAKEAASPQASATAATKDAAAPEAAPPAPQPPEQKQTAAGEAAVVTESVAPAPQPAAVETRSAEIKAEEIKAGGTVVATAAKPEIKPEIKPEPAPVEAPARQEAPPAAPATTGSAAQEPDADTPAAAEHKE
jgi:hypothetical protein